MKVFLFVALLASAYARPSETNPEYGDLWRGDIELKDVESPLPSETNPIYGDLWQGDIKIQEGESPIVSKFNAIADRNRLWTDNTLYYTIVEADFTQAEIDEIVAGADELSSNSNGCVQLIRVPSDNPGVRNYCFVRKLEGCWSYVGMNGGAQGVSLDHGCVNRGTIMHELLHALGFHHEQMRADRDDYVTIHWDNIVPKRRGNFNKLREGITVEHQCSNSYDYNSVMHYGRTAFAIDYNHDTITPHDPNAEIGWKKQMSEIDSERVQILYGCLDTKVSKHFRNMSIEDIFAVGTLVQY